MAELVFRHVDDIPKQEMRAQLHGSRRAGAYIRRLDSAPHHSVLFTDYDPGMVIGAHGHRSDHVIFVLEGLLHVGDVECRPGTMVLLEHGMVFGPLIAGPDGTSLLEFYTGDTRSVPVDPEGFRSYLRDLGIVPVEPSGLRADAPNGRPASGIVRTRTTLEVTDVGASATFYGAALGLESRRATTHSVSEAVLEGGGASLSVVRRPDPSISSTVACTFEVTDVDGALERCESAGATIAASLTVEPTGLRQFVLVDPDGHRIAVGESLA